MKLSFKGHIKHTKTDFVIVSQTGMEIPCHKFVLAEMSTVFNAMFEMEESREVTNGRIEIRDVSDKALTDMVNFIYTPDENEDIIDLDEDEDDNLLAQCISTGIFKKKKDALKI